MKPSITLVLFNYILFIFLLFPWKSVYIGNKISIGKKYSQQSMLFYGMTLLIVSVFGFSDFDFWSCWTAYKNSRSGYSSAVIEPLYNLLAQLCPNYFLWRLCIWGLALYLMLKTLSKLQDNYKSTLIFITLLYVLSFYKLRNVLGFSVLFWGLTLIVTSPNKDIKNKLSGILFILLSFWCHRTMILSILFLGFCFIKLNKTKVYFLMILWPVLITLIVIIISSFLNIGIYGEYDSMNFMEKANRYVNKENETATLFGLIRTGLTISAYLLPLIYMTKKIIFDKIAMPKYIPYFFNYWFFICYISYLFAFQGGSNWIYIRLNTMGFFPMCVVLGWYWATHKRTIQQRGILILCLLVYLFSTTYMLYKPNLSSAF